jgi:hypothetical protein
MQVGKWVLVCDRTDLVAEVTAEFCLQHDIPAMGTSWLFDCAAALQLVPQIQEIAKM